MEQHELVSALAQLQAELSKTDQADPAALDRLRELTAEVDRMVDEREATSQEDAEGVTSGLQDLLLKFEAEHPQLSMTLGKVADALASLGI
jgi:ABC-type transporter Mla subunit MlaD